MNINKIARSIIFSLIPLSATANVQGDLNNFFSNLGYNGNVTSANHGKINRRVIFLVVLFI